MLKNSEKLKERFTMKTGRKLTVLILALMLTSATLLTGCGGGSKVDYSTLQQDVVKGSNVFVTDSDVVFFGYDNLLCTALFKDGTVYDYVVEAGFTGEVFALAVYDNALYVTASDGIFKYDLEMFSGSGTASPVVDTAPSFPADRRIFRLSAVISW